MIELMVVVVILGILAVVGGAQYAKVVEKSRGAEAKEILLKAYAGYQRRAFDGEDTTWSLINGRWDRLGMSDPNAIPAPPRYFNYTFSNVSGVWVTATRVGDASKALTVNLASGAITATSPY